jgi:hypothetical protein
MHPNKHIRAALKYAESKGWLFRKSGPRAFMGRDMLLLWTS